MKKIYNLIALFVMLFAAVGINAQKYALLDEVSVIEDGVQYALFNVSNSQNAAGANVGVTANLVDDYNLWVFEKTGKTVEGYVLWRMKNVGQNAYWQKESYKLNKENSDDRYRDDGYDLHGYIGCNASWGTVENAMEVTVEMAGEGNDRITGSTTGGFVICNSEVFPWEGNTANKGYYKLEPQTSGGVINIAFAPWGNENVWKVYTVHENTSKEKIEILLDEIAENPLNIAVGDYPGYYKQSVVDTWNNVFTKATNSVVQELTEEEFAVIYNELVEGYETIKKSINPVVEGYYYLVNGYGAFFENQDVEKAMYGKSETEPEWKTFDPADYSFLWKISPREGGWDIYNVYQDSYIYGASMNAYSYPVKMRKDLTTRYQIFTPVGQGQFNIYNSSFNIPYHANGHSSGAGNGGNIVTWNEGADSPSAWKLVPVTDQKYIDAAINAKEQEKIRAELASYITLAGNVYDKLFVTSPDMENPLITKADDSVPFNEEGNQIFCNRKEAGLLGGRYGALIDGIVTTGNNPWLDVNGNFAYLSSMTGSNNAQPNGHMNDDVDFLQIDLSETPVQKFVFQSYPAKHDLNTQPMQIGVWVTNDTIGFCDATDKWTRVQTVYPKICKAEEAYTSPLIELDQKYKYVRFTIEMVNSGKRSFAYSEFQLYNAGLDENLSQYYYIPGMKEVADNLKEVTDRVKAAVEEGHATLEMKEELTNAVNAVKALYADPTELKSLIAKATNEVKYAVVGEEFGNIKTQQSVNNYDNAVKAASALDLTGAITKTELDNAVNAIKDARNAFINDMVTPEPGKWYYIKSLDTKRSKALNSYVYANNIGEGSSTKWGAPENLENKATAMWRFVPVEGAEQPHTYYIQNMAGAFYVGDNAVNSNANVYLITTPVAYTFTYAGKGYTAICPTENNLYNYSLGAANFNYVQGLSYAVGGVNADETENTVGLWTFVEATTDAGVSVPVFEGLNAKVLPFAVSELSAINENYKTYAIADIKVVNGVTTVSLYEKDSFEAGEPFFLDVPAAEEGAGDPELICEAPTTDLVTTPGVSNGLVGVFANTTIEAGMGISSNGNWVASTGGMIGRQNGYIDLSKYVGPVEGVKIVRTIVIEGLNYPDAVGGINAENGENGVKAAKGIFTIDGKAVSAPQKGQIYIINGKKVRY